MFRRASGCMRRGWIAFGLRYYVFFCFLFFASPPTWISCFSSSLRESTLWKASAYDSTESARNPGWSGGTGWGVRRQESLLPRLCVRNWQCPWKPPTQRPIIADNVHERTSRLVSNRYQSCCLVGWVHERLGFHSCTKKTGKIELFIEDFKVFSSLFVTEEAGQAKLCQWR